MDGSTEKLLTGSNPISPHLYHFPREIREENAEWPLVKFSIEHDEFAAHMPIPPGITFGDSATYSTIDLGVLGNVIVDAGRDAVNELKSGSGGKLERGGRALGTGISSMTEGVKTAASNMNEAAAASILSRNLLHMEDVANRIDYTARQILAPNTNTTFQNTGLRQFSFVYKLVSKDREDAYQIKNILDGFRKHMYPVGDKTVLQYPKTWNIDFYTESGNENSFIPKIHESYLISFSSTYNSSTNLWHEDGSPVEVDVNMTFQETKALRQDEITEL